MTSTGFSNGTDIYYNVRLTPGTPGVPVPASFTDNRPSALIDRPSDYRMSVIQFNISNDQFPLLYVEHPTPSTRLTNYIFTIADLMGNVASSSIIWTPEVDGLQPGTGDMNDPFWYCYNIQYFVKLANKALANAMTELSLLNSAFNTVPPPFFQFNPQTCSCQLYVPVELSSNQTAQIGNLYANELAYILFQGLPANYNPTNPLLTWEYDIFTQPADSLEVIGGHDFVQAQQTPGSLSSWSPIKRVAFTTSIAVNPESITPQTGTQGLTTQTILTDITPIIERGDELASGSLYYNPTAEYRFADVISQTPLTVIDFNVYWMDRYGGSHLVYLDHNGTCQAKILFRKKHI